MNTFSICKEELRESLQQALNELTAANKHRSSSVQRSSVPSSSSIVVEESTWLSRFWEQMEDKERAETAPLDYLTEFVDFAYENDIIATVARAIIISEANQVDRSSLFRETSVGIAILSVLWYRYEGTKYLSMVVLPLIKSVASIESSLEIDNMRVGDEETVNVRNNVDIILEEVEKLLLRLYSCDRHFPLMFKMIFSTLDATVTVRFQDIGYSVVGGILFLRLINPSIVAPQNYDLIDPHKITPHGARALVIVSKVIQAMANNTTFNTSKDRSFMITNRFIKKHMPRWNAYFHKLVTGNELAAPKTEVTRMEVDVDDLVYRTNHDLYKQLTCSVTISKQRELVTTIFSLEKQAVQNCCKKKKGFTFYYEQYKKSTKVLSGFSTVVGTPIATLYQFLNHESFPAMGFKTLEVKLHYSDNLQILHTKQKMSFPFNSREYLLLRYSEILPEDNFAILAFTSVDENVADVGKSNNVFGEMIAGFVIRAGPNTNSSNVSFISFADMKGSIGRFPFSEVFLRKSIQKTYQPIIRMMNELFGVAFDSCETFDSSNQSIIKKTTKKSVSSSTSDRSLASSSTAYTFSRSGE